MLLNYSKSKPIIKIRIILATHLHFFRQVIPEQKFLIALIARGTNLTRNGNPLYTTTNNSRTEFYFLKPQSNF